MSKKPSATQHPRKSSGTTGKGKKKVDFKGYANWTLTPQHKVHYQKWLEQQPDLDDLVMKVLETEHDLKVRYDDYNQCFSAQLYCRDVSHENAGWCLSMRASDYWEAIRRLLFVHCIALEGIWNSEEEAGWQDDAW